MKKSFYAWYKNLLSGIGEIKRGFCKTRELVRVIKQLDISNEDDSGFACDILESHDFARFRRGYCWGSNLYCLINPLEHGLLYTSFNDLSRLRPDRIVEMFEV